MPHLGKTEKKRVHVFADESGNLDFHAPGRKRDATRYFILTTVTAPDFSFGTELLEFRRELAWQGVGVSEEWHATENNHKLRDLVFDKLLEVDFTVDATIYEKAKVAEYYRTGTRHNFYRFAWHWHFAHIAPLLVNRGDELFVMSASYGDKKIRQQCHEAVEDVTKMCAPDVHVRTVHWRDDSDPCLTIADYASWAIFRKWERLTPKYYNLIKSRIRTEIDFFQAHDGR